MALPFWFLQITTKFVVYLFYIQLKRFVTLLFLFIIVLVFVVKKTWPDAGECALTESIRIIVTVCVCFSVIYVWSRQIYWWGWIIYDVWRRQTIWAVWIEMVRFKSVLYSNRTNPLFGYHALNEWNKCGNICQSIYPIRNIFTANCLENNKLKKKLK